MEATQGLEEALAALDPQLGGDYVIVTGDSIPPGLTPFAIIEEPVGKTLVVPAVQATQFGYGDEPIFSRVDAGTPTSLFSVGVTATITQTIASRGIPCNVLAGFHHDHFFVPKKYGREVVNMLRTLANHAKGWLPEKADS